MASICFFTSPGRRAGSGRATSSRALGKLVEDYVGAAHAERHHRAR
jgi:hypothetical protein